MSQTVSPAGEASAPQARAGLRALMRRPGPRASSGAGSRRRKGAGPAWLTPRLLEIAYVALLAILLVRLVHAVLTPVPAPVVDAPAARAEAGPADLSVFSRYDPFGGTVGGEAAPVDEYANAAETTLDLRLVGTSGGGGVKTASVETPNGRQRAYLIGDEILPGVSLRDVRPPNQAILSRSGVAETLTIAGREGTAGLPGRAAPPGNLPTVAAPVEVAPAIASTIDEGPASPQEAQEVIANAFRLEPADDGALAVYPGDAPELFRAAGFQPGDVVTAVDGSPAPQDTEALFAMMADLPPGRPFTVTIERQGMALDVPIDLSRTAQ